MLLQTPEDNGGDGWWALGGELEKPVQTLRCDRKKARRPQKSRRGADYSRRCTELVYNSAADFASVRMAYRGCEKRAYTVF